jgi:hypothetical protein
MANPGDRPSSAANERFDYPWLRFPETVYVNGTMPDRFHDLFALDPVRPHQVAELIRVCVRHPDPGRYFELVGGALTTSSR